MYLYYTRCITVCKVQKTVIFDAFRQARFGFPALFPAFCCPVFDWYLHIGDYVIRRLLEKFVRLRRVVALDAGAGAFYNKIE